MILLVLNTMASIFTATVRRGAQCAFLPHTGSSEGNLMSEPSIAQKSPFVMEVEPGSYAWCACGRSAKQPYCDGSHSGTDFRPIIVEITEAQKVVWCGCKHSGNGARCDGSHKNL